MAAGGEVRAIGRMAPGARAGRLLVPFAVAEAILLVVFWWPGADTRAQAAVFILSRVLSTAAMVVGALSAQRAVRTQWLLLLGAVVLWTAMELVVAAWTAATGTLASWTWTGVGPLVGYVLMSAGMTSLARREGFLRGSAVWLESVVVGVSYLLVWWLVTGHGLVSRDGVDQMDLLANLFSLGDLLALASAVVLLSSRSEAVRSNRALAAGCVAAVVGDLLFSAAATGAADPEHVTFPWFWMLQHACLAAGALLAHRADVAPRSRTVTVETVVMVVVAVIAPMLVFSLSGHWRLHAHGVRSTAVVVVAGTVALLGLAATRFGRLVREVERQSAELAATARTDDLTGLPNRRAGTRVLGDALRDAETTGRGLAVAVIDLDHFKVFNDTHGHLEGDRLLAAAARAWTTALAGRGMLYRHGGEEFVVVLPHDDGTDDADDTAVGVLARMRAATPRGQSFSAGLARWQPGDDAQTLLGRADTHLYLAKERGRARTEDGRPAVRD